MMARVIDAIYENGMLKPLETLDLPEHQRVRITIHEPIVESLTRRSRRVIRCTKAVRKRRSHRLRRSRWIGAVSCGRSPKPV
jgi:predicted DNA-binding antitoxin AbrB/MazE fold protein